MELLTPSGVLYVVQLLWSDPERHFSSDELEPLLNAFEATIRSGGEYKDMIKGPRAGLQRWFSQHRRGRDVWRVYLRGWIVDSATLFTDRHWINSVIDWESDDGEDGKSR